MSGPNYRQFETRRAGARCQTGTAINRRVGSKTMNMTGVGCVSMPTKVLLVEDEVLISELVSEALREQGFSVHAVDTADAALGYLDGGGDADILFTDINLPGVIDGVELAKRARDLRPELPIVYASGRFTAGDLTPLVPRSIFLTKPYNPSDVCTLLGRLALPTAH
jgi:two-component system, response regulator PdtaR